MHAKRNLFPLPLLLCHIHIRGETILEILKTINSAILINYAVHSVPLIYRSAQVDEETALLSIYGVTASYISVRII